MQFLLSEIPQQLHAVLVSLQKDVVNEMAVSTDWILEITRTSNAEVLSVKEKPQTTRTDVMKPCHTLTRYLRIFHNRRLSQTPRSSS